MKRFWEIDFARGLSVILMVIFNWSFTLKFFNLLSFDSWLYWVLFPVAIAASFIFIAGLSLYVSYSHRKDKKHIILRGLKIFGLGLLITINTFITFQQNTVWFGILHLIGLSIILSVLFLKFNKWNLLIGLIILIAGSLISINSNSFLWLGYNQSNVSFDYEPLLPWFGFFLLGLGFGSLLYKNGKRSFKLKEFSEKNVINLMGRHSLLIYILHQPLLLGILFLLGLLSF